jgi:hypothetical protein
MSDDQNEQQSKGLGDTIANLTHAVGIDKVAESIANAMGKSDCGCKKRQQKLNQLFPYKSNQENSVV